MKISSLIVGICALTLAASPLATSPAAATPGHPGHTSAAPLPLPASQSPLPGVVWPGHQAVPAQPVMGFAADGTFIGPRPAGGVRLPVGVKIAGGNAAQQGKHSVDFFRRVTLSPSPSLISFTLSAAHPGTLSTATSTTWSWRSASVPAAKLPLGWWCGQGPLSKQDVGTRDCAVEPMMTLRYAVQKLALDGSAPAGPQRIQLNVGHLQLVHGAPVTTAAMQVSFDGGKTWHPATVTGSNGSYTALFTAPAGALVTLRTSSADAAGGSITETITNAYATTH
jgi:hypothetical protein